MRIRILSAILVVLCLSFEGLASNDITVSSPDGQVQFGLTIDAQQRLAYFITFKNKAVIDTSAVGITVDRVNLGEGVEIGTVDRYQVNETYPWHGPHSTAVNHCNGAKIALRHLKSRTAYALEIRAYDAGVAFRQVVPGEGTRVPDEATSFRLPAGITLWYHDLDEFYEGVHREKSVEAVPPGAWMAPPVTFKLPADLGYAAITEGALRQYAGMALQAGSEQDFPEARGLLLHARLAHAHPVSWGFRIFHRSEIAHLAQPTAITGTITTPWRVVMIGPDLNTLVNCDVVHNVAPPPDPRLFPNGLKTDWIKPGRSVWAYLDGGDETLEGQKEFSKLAGELGFEYNLLENFWSKWPESQLKELVDYSRQRGVGIFLWKFRADIQDPQRLRELLEMCRRTGVAGLKIDFFDHEGKEVVDLYEMMLKMAAEYKILVDFHGANKPTGMERTWPNQVGQEGIRGFEFGPPYARHEVTLPFTRLLVGLGDYTPTHFGKRMADTTWAHQIANAAILQAPLLVYAAHPVTILANPAVDIIKSIPSVWDETMVLPASEIGETAAFARRKGDTWFVAVTNGPTARTIRIDLSFLGAESYVSTLVRDSVDPADVKVEHLTAKRNDSIYVDLRSGGGFIGRFSK
jgi:alpha-glucosidase